MKVLTKHVMIDVFIQPLLILFLYRINQKCSLSNERFKIYLETEFKNITGRPESITLNSFGFSIVSCSENKIIFILIDKEL